MKVRIKYNHKVLVENIIVADDLMSRLIGLMFRKRPPKDANGLLLSPCNSIHTFFMKYSLDVAFMNPANQVVKIIRNLKPWRMTWVYLNATKTLEVPAGDLPRDLCEGEFLEVEYV